MRIGVRIRASVPLIAVIILSSLALTQAVPVSLDCSLHNSDDSISVSMDGDNLNFRSSAVIEPHSMLYQNGGSSNQRQCDYDYGLSLNDNPLAAGASSDSGGFAWGGNAASGEYASGSEILSLSARHMVDDGMLRSYFSDKSHEVTNDVLTDGAAYSEALSLDLDGISSKGKGLTTDPEFSYSFEQAVDGQSMGSGANSDSGAAQWSFRALSSGTDGGTIDAAVSLQNGVEDGHLASALFNPNVRVDETVDVAGATYFQKANIDLNELDLAGTGVTKGAEASSQNAAETDALAEESAIDNSDASDASDAKSIEDTLCVSTADKSGSISADLAGDTKAIWQSGVDASPKEYSFDMLVNGQGTVEDMDEFGMEGEATGLPAQVLPAGTVEISYDYPREDFQDHLEMTEEEIEQFCQDYSLAKPGPSLWYYLQQKSFVYPYNEVIDPVWVALPEDYYRMGMSFNFRG